MSSVAFNTRRTFDSMLSRLFLPTAALLTVTLGVVFLTVLWASDNANDAAEERQRLQLTAALDQRVEKLCDHLALASLAVNGAELSQAGAAADEMAERLVAQVRRLSNLDGVFLVDADGTALAGAIDRAQAGQVDYLALSDQVADLVETARLSPPGTIDRALSALRSNARGILAVAAMPVEALDRQGGHRPLVAVGFQRLGVRELTDVSDLLRLQDFTVTTAVLPSNWAAAPVFDAQGRAQASLVWRPDRPGDLIRGKLVPLMAAGATGALLIFGMIVMHVRRIATDLAQHQEQAQFLMGCDPLSGLPNRMLFSERLDRELIRLDRSETGVAVMFLDLDRFKDVNDTYGHQAGDELIKAVAGRIAGLLRGVDTLARFGGDEFAIIQTGVRDLADVEALARRILDEITHPFAIADTSVMVGVSIGIALAPENGRDRETLMRLADTALYQAKSDGRNRFSFFERQMDDTIRMRKVVEDDLRHAIENDGLSLVYQPIFASTGDKIVAVEALVRWPHPKQGLISPTRFIAIAEERGLIIPLGEWVLRRACRDAKHWPGVRVAVNVSPIQFRHKEFVGSVMSAVMATGFEPSRLELELTEGVVVEDADAAEAAMMELRALGVNLALDDFGTGYSSLIYLRRFAFDKIKIDRSFLESMEATGESAILVHSIVHLGRALGLTVTAEGVETKEQHRFLQALGCHELQGYLFSRPVPAAEIDRLLGAAPPAAAADAA